MTLNFTPTEKQRIKDLALMFHSKMAVVDGCKVVLPYDRWFYAEQERSYEQPREKVPEQGTGVSGDRL